MTRENHHISPYEAPRIAVLGSATLQLLGIGFINNDRFHNSLRAHNHPTNEQENDNLAAADVLVRIPDLISLGNNSELTDGLPPDPAPGNRYVPSLITTLTDVDMYTPSGEPSPALEKVAPFLQQIYPALPFRERITLGMAEDSLPWPESSSLRSSYRHLKSIATDFLRSLPKIKLEVTHLYSHDTYLRTTSDVLSPGIGSPTAVGSAGLRMPAFARGPGEMIQASSYASLYVGNAADYLTGLLGHMESLNSQLVSNS